MVTLPARVYPVKGTQLTDEKRGWARRKCLLGATSRSLEAETLTWGGTVHDLSEGGLLLKLCYPFRPGTCLAIDLQTSTGQSHALLARVVHVRDRADGIWVLGCEFVTPLTSAELAELT